MEKLINYLNIKINELSNIDNNYNLSEEFLYKLYSVYPFNKFEYIISHLIGTKIISLQQYIDLRNSYIERNKFLYVF